MHESASEKGAMIGVGRTGPFQVPFSPMGKFTAVNKFTMLQNLTKNMEHLSIFDWSVYVDLTGSIHGHESCSSYVSGYKAAKLL